jgi:hypothetical protein
LKNIIVEKFAHLTRPFDCGTVSSIMTKASVGWFLRNACDYTSADHVIADNRSLIGRRTHGAAAERESGIRQYLRAHRHTTAHHLNAKLVMSASCALGQLQLLSPDPTSLHYPLSSSSFLAVLRPLCSFGYQPMAAPHARARAHARSHISGKESAYQATNWHTDVRLVGTNVPPGRHRDAAAQRAGDRATGPVTLSGSSLLQAHATSSYLLLKTSHCLEATQCHKQQQQQQQQWQQWSQQQTDVPMPRGARGGEMHEQGLFRAHVHARVSARPPTSGRR